jgi:hypothetical protein
MTPERCALFCEPVPRTVRATCDIRGADGDPRVIQAGELLHLAPPVFLSALYKGPRGCNVSALRAAGLLATGQLVAAEDDPEPAGAS